MDATAIATVSDIYEFVSVSDSGDDNLIQDLIDRKTVMFSNYCEIDSFFIADYIEYYNGRGSEYLFVKNNPINSITNIADDTDWLWGADSTISSNDYRIVENRYVVYKYTFADGKQNVRISYNAGYSVIPLDLKQILIEEVWRNYKRRKEQDVLIKTLQDGSTHFVPSGLMPSTKQVLDKYKRMRSY